MHRPGRILVEQVAEAVQVAGTQRLEERADEPLGLFVSRCHGQTAIRRERLAGS
jgi:hypothetical protein